MSNKIISLKSNFKKIFITSMSIFLCIQLILITVLLYYNNRTNQAYMRSSVAKTAANISNYLDQIEKNGFSVSSNYNFISLYSAEKYLPAETSFVNAYQAASSICTLNPSVIDLIVIDLNGSKKSFFSGYNYDITDVLDTKNVLSDASNLDRAFYFFSASDESYHDYFLYYFPIFGHDTSPINAQKVATAVFICNNQEIVSDLMPEGETSTVFSLYHNDQLLCSSSSDTDHLTNSKTSPEPYTIELKPEGLNVKGISTSLFALQKVTVQISIYLIVMICSFVILMLFINKWIHRYITIPIESVTNQLQHFYSGDLNKRITLTNVQEINDIVNTTNYMIDNIKAITKKIFNTQDLLYETELRKTEVELYALQSQINPHFLYNTMQCIRGLATLNRTEDIKTITLAMSDVFKYSIAPGRYVHILDEIEIISKYLSIYKIRFDNRMEYEIDVDEEILQYYTVKMIIQPTVENAMLHAFKDMSRKPCVHILGHIEDGKIIFRIIDNGNGISRNSLKEIQTKLNTSFDESIKKKSSYGIGLYNINRRIKLAYGEEYGIQIFSNMNGTEVTIIIPVQTDLPNELPTEDLDT